MKHSKSALVLMELILVILFFSLASTVCIQLFAQSHLLSSRTVNENHAVIHAQNLAECFLATEGDIPQMNALFQQDANGVPDNTVMLFFNKDWEECDEKDAGYYARLVKVTDTEDMIFAEITVDSYPDDANEPIYTLTITHHISQRRAGLD